MPENREREVVCERDLSMVSGWGRKIALFSGIAFVFVLFMWAVSKSSGGSSGPGTAVVTSASRIIRVSDVWTDVRLPKYFCFQLDPDKKILIRLADGREFEELPGRKLFYQGKEIPDLGNVPGFSISIKAAESGTIARVVFSEVPKDS